MELKLLWEIGEFGYGDNLCLLIDVAIDSDIMKNHEAWLLIRSTLWTWKQIVCSVYVFVIRRIVFMLWFTVSQFLPWRGFWWYK